MDPEKVVEMLNHYLDIQNAIVESNRGEVDKFVGDEVMAMFKGRDRERNACQAGMEIRKAMAREKELATPGEAEGGLHRHRHPHRPGGLRLRRRRATAWTSPASATR